MNKTNIRITFNGAIGATGQIFPSVSKDFNWQEAVKV